MIEKAEQAVTSPTRAKRPAVIDLTVIALVTAITCILAPLSIPIVISPVPVTLTNLVLYLSLYILKTRKALISYLIYLMLGLVGLPVFSGFFWGVREIGRPYRPLCFGGIYFYDPGPRPLCRAGARKNLAPDRRTNPWNCGLLCFWNRLAGRPDEDQHSRRVGHGRAAISPGDGAKMILAALTGQEIAKRIKAAQM